MMSTWTRNDAVMRNFFENFSNDNLATISGLRLLRQNPREALFAFITSANNNVSRISKLMLALGAKYGKPLGIASFAFPTLEVLARPGFEKELRQMGFGYRANYIPCVCFEPILSGKKGKYSRVAICLNPYDLINPIELRLKLLSSEYR